MPVNLVVKVPDKDLVGFSEEAKTKLKDALDNYSQQVISQARSIESTRRNPERPIEITGPLVIQAVDVVGVTPVQKNSFKAKAIRILAAVLPLILGIAYVPDQLKDQWYLLGFLVYAVITIVLVILSVWGHE